MSTSSPDITVFDNNQIDVDENINQHETIHKDTKYFNKKINGNHRIHLTLSPERTTISYLNDWLFPLTLIATVTLCIGGGLFTYSIPPVKRKITTSIRKIKTEFRINKQPSKSHTPPIKKEKPVVKKDKPVDLTRKKEIDKAPLQKTPEVDESKIKPPEKKVRKVFGLRRVYSTGLGSGGSMTDAVVGKIGNTIDKKYDTVTATKADIKGSVVSTATVTTAPRFKKRVKPVYSEEMIENKIQGTVKVKVLVDIDGKVKKATCLNDIGYDSAKQALKATLAMEFDPAMRGDIPVAVWIIVPIRFVLLG